MFKSAKLALSIIVLSSTIPVFTVNAQEESKDNIYTQYIQEAIEQEMQLGINNPTSIKGISRLNTANFNQTLDGIMENNSLKSTTKQNIAKLENAEVVILDINENGDLVSATSSKDGDIKSKFETKEPTVTESTYVEKNQNSSVINSTYGPLPYNRLALTTQSLITNQGNTAGKETGAFHRLQTPTSTSSMIYNGVVADSIVLPNYNIDGAYNYKETAYLYTGVDTEAEVGLEAVTSASTATGWYPSFHAKFDHTLVSGDNNGYPSNSNIGRTYVDRSKKFLGGSTIAGYKVYYYTTDSTLTIREQINYSDIYVVRINGKGSAGRSVKRVTAIAMNQTPSTSTPFHYGFTSPVIWNNMRFLTNNSASTVYPNNVQNLSNDVWTHGGKIDYINNTSNHTEKYTFSVS